MPICKINFRFKCLRLSVPQHDPEKCHRLPCVCKDSESKRRNEFME